MPEIFLRRQVNGEITVNAGWFTEFPIQERLTVFQFLLKVSGTEGFPALEAVTLIVGDSHSRHEMWAGVHGLALAEKARLKEETPMFIDYGASLGTLMEKLLLLENSQQIVDQPRAVERAT